MKLMNLFWVLCLAVIATGCDDDNDNEENVNLLRGTTWECVKIMDIEADTIIPFAPIKAADSYILKFVADSSQFFTKGAANTIAGKYELDKENIRLFDTIMTDMGVIGGDPFEKGFRAVDSYALKDDGLQLFFNNKKGCLYFEKH